MDKEADERAICSSVVKSLQFVDGYLADFNDQVLYSETVDHVHLARDLHRRMRTQLPVPSIYCALKVLQRLAEYGELQRDAMDDERTVKLPKSKTDVDFTVKQIFKTWNEKVNTFLNQHQDFNELGWNPWKTLVETLDVVVKHNFKAFFGL